MTDNGRIALYLTKDGSGYVISNWPGTLKFPAAIHWTRRHNWWSVSKVHYVRFIGPDFAVWSGKNLGDMEICHCKRTKIDPSQISY